MTSVATPLTASRAAPPPPRTPRLFRLSRGALRVVASLHALLALSQALSIGQYLDGSYTLLRVHAVAAGILVLAGAALGLVAVLYAVAGGRVWVAAVCVPFYLAEGIQTGLGYSRSLGVHVPLGVAIVGGAVAVAVWSWTRASGRSRRSR